MATDKGLDFSKILVAKSIPYLTDYHLWFSTLIKPSDCHISRAQRLTCCLCLLMSYMALSIACYQYIGPRYRGEFSLIDISWQSIIVGISVIALPPTVLIISIFRRSKVHRNRFEENLSKDYDAKESDRHLSSSEDEPSGLSVFEQTMLSWQSLQEWAQKAWTKRYQQLPIGSTQNVKPVTIQNASDQQQPSMNFEKMDQSQTEDLMAGQLKPGEGVVVIILHPVSWNLYRRRRGISLCRQLVTIQTEAWQLPRLLCCSTSASFLWHHPSFGCSSWSRCASSPGTSSNRSSVKLTCSATSNCTKETPSKKWRCFLPYRSIYVGWSLCVILIMGCAAVTIYYGYRFSAAQSILWLQSVFFSFLHCIFITHPMIVLAIMLYSGLRYRNDMSIFDHYSDGLITDKELARDSVGDSSHEKQKLGHSASEPKTLAEGIAARQRSRYLRFARPPQEQRLIQARHQTMKERNASALINETVLFVGQFLLLVFIAFGKEMEPSYQLKASLTKTFVSNGNLSFEKVSTVGDWWLWVNDHFLETIYSDEGYVDNCYPIGPVILRQLRIRDEECHIRPASVTGTGNPRCRGVFDQAPHETNVLIKNGTPYYYADSDVTGVGTIDGKFSSYEGGGYVESLNQSDRSKATWHLRNMQESAWIDEHTSAVVIEFTLFHPQSNLFATVSLLLEVPPLGMAFTSSRIAVVFLYKYITAMDNLVLACELLFFLATMLKIHHEIIQVLRHGINYLKNVWNVLEVSQCLLSLALIICYTYRFLLIDSLVEKFRSTYLEEFIDVSNLAYWDQVLRSVTGFVLLLVNLQLVKGLRHHQPFARFTNVYNHTSLDFVVFGCMFVIWLGAYVSLGIALFSGIKWEMTSVSQAVGYMTGLLECSYEFPHLKGLSASETTIWEIYTMTFLILAYGSIAGYLLAFLTFHYKVFKDEPVLVFGLKESFVYHWNKAVSLFVRKPDDHDHDAYNGQKQPDIVLPPEFTMAEIQYQVDEMLFKMNALAGTSNLPEKPVIYFTDSDTTCVGIGEDLSSNTGSSGEGNFEGWLNRMKENLFLNEPHFAQLINCNSQSVVKQEANKQLMLQLEMEILRQLQSKRSSNNHLNESGINATNGPAGGGGGEGEGGGVEVGAGALSSHSGCQSTSSTDSSTSAALYAHMSSASTRPWKDQINSLKEVPRLVTEGGKSENPSPMSGYLMTLDSESNRRTRAANDLGIIQHSRPDGNVSRDAVSALELQVLSHLRSLADDNRDEDKDDDFDCPLALLSGDFMETELGSDTIRRLLVPGKNRGQHEGMLKLGKVPSWTSTASIGSDASHTECREVATEIPAAVHLPSAPVAHLGRCKNTEEGFGLVEEDVFGFENEGYVIESSGEDSGNI